MRIGNGYDVHQLEKGRDLILCGVKIDYEFGLLGHSDADVATHAIIDALLGAAGLDDIGTHFPDTDAQYKGIKSTILLQKTGELLRENGYKIGNIDVIIVAQKPKLAVYFAEMKKNIADALNISEKDINIKAKTEEKLGFTGRMEGMKSYAVALIE